jgi:hypothetical protein
VPVFIPHFYWQPLVARAFSESLDFVDTGLRAIGLALIGFLVTAVIVLFVRGWEKFKEHLIENGLIAFGGALGTWVLVFLFFLVYEVPREITVQANNISIPALVGPSLPQDWNRRTPKPPQAKPWSYAFFYRVWPWTQSDQRVALFVANLTNSNLHNVSVSVKELSARDLGDPNNYRRDMEMFNMRGTILSIVYPMGEIGNYVSTGLSYQFIPPFQTFQITMEPENGDAVKEVIRFGPLSDCILSITRTSDGTPLLQGVVPPFGMMTGEYSSKLPWEHCQ